MTVERFDLREIAPQPWKNGAGLTREIARAGDGETFDWRLSLAEVERDAPFSAFPGVDRCIVLMHGAGMRLRAHDGSVDHRLMRPFTPFCFSGDVALDATLIDGPSSDFNVMTRRGAFRSEVLCHRGEVEPQVADVTVLVCGAGDWIVDADTRHGLAPMQALLLRGATASLSARPRSAAAAAALLCVRLWRDRGP